MAGYLGSRPVIVQVDGYQREESESRYVNVSGDDFSGHLDFVDDAKARFGSSDELHIYTESSGSGHSYIQGDNIVIRSAAGTARLTVTSNDVDVSSGALKIGGTTVINSSQVGFLNEKTRIGTGATYPTDNAQLYIQRSNNNPYIGFFSSDGSRNAYLQSVAGGNMIFGNQESGGWEFNNGTSGVAVISNSGTLTTPTLITGAYGAGGSSGDGFRLNSTDLYGQIDASDKVRIAVNGNSFLNGGNVGIGEANNTALTNNLGTLLNVNSASIIGNGDAGAYFAYNARYNNSWLRNDTSGVGIISLTNAGRLTYRTAASGTAGTEPTLTEIISTGDANSSYVAFAGASQVRLTLGSEGTPGTNTANWIRGNGGYLQYNSANNDHSWEVGGTERMRLTSGGSVGISIDNPDAKLHVVGNTKLGSASSASWTNSLNDAGGLDVFVGSGSKALTVWDDNRQGAPRFQVDRDGQVGIGRAPTSTFKLDVHEELSGNWLAHFENTHNSNGYGVKIRAGDDVNVTSFRVSNYDNSKTLLNVYGDGTVTKPNTPAFWVRRNGNQTGYDGATVSQWGNNYVEWNYAEFNIGNHMTISGSNVGKFIAPVAGLYHFETAVYSNTSATIWSQGWFNVNGARKAGTDFILSANDEFIQYSSNIYLQASDQVAVHPFTNTGNTNTTIIANIYHTWFKGHLIA